MRDESIFLAAAEIQSPEERRAYLEIACDGDPALHAQVESLLKHLALSEGFLESPPRDLMPTIVGRNDATVQGNIKPDAFPFLTRCGSTGCLGRLGMYEVLEVVGRGAMGVVLRARDPKLDRIVALKVMLPELAASAAAVNRFLKEARAAAAVRDDHVVLIHAVHDEGPVPYLVMEFVEGETLQHKIDRERKLAVGEVIRIGREIALGLAAAHRRGLVHLDVKPANILLDSDTGRARITDFGLAHIIDDANETQTRAFAGTPSYIAPERALGNRGDQRADLFSLGAVIYAMCSGKTPFRADTPLATLRRVCEVAHQPLRVLDPSIPEWLEQIVNRLLEKNPDLRPGSAGVVARMLSGSREDASLTEPVFETTAPSAPSAVSPIPRGSRASRAGATVLLLLALSFIVVCYGKLTRFEVPEDEKIIGKHDGVVEIQLTDAQESRQPTADNMPPASSRGDAADATQWERATALLPARDQVEAVTVRLRELNPALDGHLKATIEKGVVIGLEMISTNITDLSPLRGLPHLKVLRCDGVGPDRRSPLSDLSPLTGLKLTSFNCNYSQIADLSPLKGMPLSAVSCAYTNVRDLSPLSDMRLEHLEFQSTMVSDLLPARGMPLISLNCSMTPVTDLSPLVDSPLTTLYFDETHITDLSPLAKLPLRILHWRLCDPTDPGRRRIIEGIRTLVEIDNKTPEEFWRNNDRR